MIHRTLASLGALLLLSAACHEEPRTTPPGSATTTTPPPATTEAAPPPPATTVTTAPPPPTTAQPPPTTPPPSSGTATSPPPSDGRCKADTDCPTGFHCAQGMPLNGRCWKNGQSEPICLPPDARIATPVGEVAVRDLAVGSLVWTQDAAGNRVPAPVRSTSRTRVPAGHMLARVVLEDGRSVSASPGHPTCGVGASGVGELSSGSPLDHAAVRTVERVPFAGPETFDILPAGDTGCYWANGVLLGSTLRQ